MNNRNKFTATRRGTIGAGLCALITVALLSAQSIPADAPEMSSGSGLGIGMVELA